MHNHINYGIINVWGCAEILPISIPRLLFNSNQAVILIGGSIFDID